MPIDAVTQLLLLLAAQCTAGTEFEPPLCPSGLPAVRAVRVESNGIALWRDTSTHFDCSQFRLGERNVRYFFRNARRADEGAVHYTLPESPCVSRGRVTFVDGTTAHWRIDRYGLGWLDRSGLPKLVLYCRACRMAPFVQ